MPTAGLAALQSRWRATPFPSFYPAVRRGDLVSRGRLAEEPRPHVHAAGGKKRESQGPAVCWLTTSPVRGGGAPVHLCPAGTGSCAPRLEVPRGKGRGWDGSALQHGRLLPGLFCFHLFSMFTLVSITHFIKPFCLLQNYIYLLFVILHSIFGQNGASREFPEGHCLVTLPSDTRLGDLGAVQPWPLWCSGRLSVAYGPAWCTQPSWRPPESCFP